MQKSLNKKIFRKTIATILVFVMVFQFMPNIVFALNKTSTANTAKTNEKTLESLDNYIKEENKKLSEEEPAIIGELEGERTLTEKHFLRADGSVVASIFPSNIHYEKDGKLLEIDNTLEEITDTKETLKIVDKNVLQDEKLETEINTEVSEETSQEENAEELEKVEDMSEKQEAETLTNELENNQEEMQSNTEEAKSENINQQDEKSFEKVKEENKITEKIDAKLAEELKKETKIYTNKTGNAKINFTNKTSGFNLGSMESEEHTITWGLLNSKASNVN